MTLKTQMLTIRKLQLFFKSSDSILTPKMTNDAPVSVAEWPPLGVGGTPSICGKAQSHCLSTILIIDKMKKIVLNK